MQRERTRNKQDRQNETNLHKENKTDRHTDKTTRKQDDERRSGIMKTHDIRNRFQYARNQLRQQNVLEAVTTFRSFKTNTDEIRTGVSTLEIPSPHHRQLHLWKLLKTSIDGYVSDVRTKKQSEAEDNGERMGVTGTK